MNSRTVLRPDSRLHAAAAIGGIDPAPSRSFQVSAEADRSQRWLKAVLKATDHAPELTAREIISRTVRNLVSGP